MMTRFADANRFCANILSAEQQELSNAMARPGTHELEPCQSKPVPQATGALSVHWRILTVAFTNASWPAIILSTLIC